METPTGENMSRLGESNQRRTNPTFLEFDRWQGESDGNFRYDFLGVKTHLNMLKGYFNLAAASRSFLWATDS